ncbi:MAG: glutamate synthase subunit beta [Flavobacteriales bacterium]
MGKLGGFKEYKRKDESYLEVEKRISNYNEFTQPLTEENLKNQGARCMNCGIPFCHSGCPLGNLIPDFNHMVYQGNWKKALEILHQTNNFPEFTGRLCPAPCEKSCVLGIIDNPVSIENIEKSIVEKGFANGWIIPIKPIKRTNKSVAIIGSGPSGLAAAQQLNRAGHSVTVFEKADELGGLLRYGIPNFKLDKSIIDRRINILKKEGIIFKTNTNVGVNFSVEKLKKFDAIVLCGGAEVPRSLPIKGIENSQVVQAMTYLTQQTKKILRKKINEPFISAKGKNVIVIGGGDTGSDCIGTANRQGAKSVTNFEIMPKPPIKRSQETPWPFYPLQLKTTSSHEEGCDRNWLINTKEIVSDSNGKLKYVTTVNVKWEKQSNQRPKLIEMPNTEKKWPCDLILLSLGFTGPNTQLAKKLNIQLDSRNFYKTKNYQTNQENIFISGDMRRGQSLIVWAISEGREVAKAVDTYLMKESFLPSKGQGDMLTAID